MIGLLLLIAVLALASLTVTLLGHAGRAGRQRRLVDEVRRIDALLSRDAFEAKRAMNEAAGQSWRNLVD